MSNYTNKCLYAVTTATGVQHMTGWQAEGRYGVRIWEYYGEAIDHSEWCPRHPDRVSIVPPDPFLITEGWSSPF